MSARLKVIALLCFGLALSACDGDQRRNVDQGGEPEAGGQGGADAEAGSAAGATVGGSDAGAQAGLAGSMAGIEAGIEAGAEAGTEGGSEAGAEAGSILEGDPSLECNNALGLAPDGVELETIAYDDGVGVATVVEQSWELAGALISEAPVHEAVRFDLDRPARVHQIQVQFGQTSRFSLQGLPVRLHADFGYNGFDFWPHDALWEGTRCAQEVTPGEWVTYTLPEPVELTQPGLIYVVNERAYPDDPALLFDGTEPPRCAEGAEDCCARFDECHSAWNFPEITDFQATPYWAGLSTSFRLDYMVRLKVEYTDDVPTEERIFQRVEGVDLGGRHAWADWDDDGDIDLLTSGPRLYRNLTEETGSFALEDVTEASGLSELPVSGGVWGDYDNDGCLDLVMFAESTTQSDVLLKGDCEGHFTDLTAFSGLTDVLSEVRCDGDDAQDRAPSASAGWVDLDADGLLDLYLPNFLCWGSGDAYLDHVWRNMGDGTFEPWAGRGGFEGDGVTPLASRHVSPIDYDQDGDMDVMVGNYRLHRNRMFVNLLNQGEVEEGAFSVEERAEAIGLAGEATTLGGGEVYGHTIGVAWGDLNGDERLDAVVANLAHPRFFHFSNKTEVLIQDDQGGFSDLQGDMASWMETGLGGAGLRYQETHSVPVLGDVDLDGRLDLIISAVYDGRPTDFYRGRGDGRFEPAHLSAGIDVDNGWGMALADMDGDGDLDLATSRGLYENRNPLTRRLEDASGSEWLALRVVGDVSSNRAGLGATVRVGAGDQVWLRTVEGSSGQGNQQSLTLHVGLGDHTSVDWIEVRFIGGEVVRYEGPIETRQRLKLLESGAYIAY